MFNIRVYGILIHQNCLLVSDEYRLDMLITKFPGGGLEFGEGILDCLKREWLEETGTQVVNASHYYTTDFFQPSIVSESSQIVSIYYKVETDKISEIVVTEKSFDFPELTEGVQRFRWLELNQLSEDDFTLPIDKVVAGMLIRENR